MKMLKIFLTGVLLAMTPVIIAACDQDSSLEEGAEEIADEIDDATTD